MVAYLLNRHFKGYLGVCMYQQNCMNTKDGVENLRILNIVAYHGVVGIQRSVDFLFWHWHLVVLLYWKFISIKSFQDFVAYEQLFRGIHDR